jgi:hypothetical protein
MVKLYLHSPICLHGNVLYLIKLAFWDITPCSPLKSTDARNCLLHAGFLLSLLFNTEDGGHNVPPKRRLTFDGLQGLISHKISLHNYRYGQPQILQTPNFPFIRNPAFLRVNCLFHYLIYSSVIELQTRWLQATTRKMRRVTKNKEKQVTMLTKYVLHWTMHIWRRVTFKRSFIDMNRLIHIIMLMMHLLMNIKKLWNLLT